MSTERGALEALNRLLNEAKYFNPTAHRRLEADYDIVRAALSRTEGERVVEGWVCVDDLCHSLNSVESHARRCWNCGLWLVRDDAHAVYRLHAPEGAEEG